MDARGKVWEATSGSKWVEVAWTVRGSSQVERPEGRVEDVAAHVAERARAEVQPRPPLHRVVRGVVGPVRHRARATGPSPVSPAPAGVSVGHRPLGEVRPRVAAHGPVGPGVDFGHVADRAVVEPLLRGLPHRLRGMALVAHLGHAFGSPRPPR